MGLYKDPSQVCPFLEFISPVCREKELEGMKTDLSEVDHSSSFMPAKPSVRSPKLCDSR